jgi:hypothetical protein
MPMILSADFTVSYVAGLRLRLFSVFLDYFYSLLNGLFLHLDLLQVRVQPGDDFLAADEMPPRGHARHTGHSEAAHHSHSAHHAHAWVTAHHSAGLVTGAVAAGVRHAAVFHPAVMVLTATAISFMMHTFSSVAFTATISAMMMSFTYHAVMAVMLPAAAAFFPAAFFMMMLVAFMMAVTAMLFIASAGLVFGFLAAFLATAFSASASLRTVLFLNFFFPVMMVHFFFVWHFYSFPLYFTFECLPIFRNPSESRYG